MTDILDFKEKLLGILYPRVCPVCGKIITRRQMNQRMDAGENPFICQSCYEKLDFFEQKSRCLKCGRILDDKTRELCDSCSRKAKFFDSGTSLMVHNDATRKILYDLKYSNMKDNADFIGYEMAKRLGRNILNLHPDVILPVPLHDKRLFERGYNQAGLMVEKTLHYMKIVCGEKIFIPESDEKFLIRNRATQALKSLKGDERSKALKGAFQVTGEMKYDSVMIVDDIYTTGSTIDECARTLKAAGVGQVFFITASA